MRSYQIRKYYVHLRGDAMRFTRSKKDTKMKEMKNNTREKIQMNLPTLTEFRILTKSAEKYVRHSYIVRRQTR